MIRFFLTMLFFFFLFPATGQLTPLTDPNRELTEEELLEDERNGNCRHRNVYSALQRAAFYPFNRAARIRLVSYDVRPDTSEGGIHLVIGNSLPIKKRQVDERLLDESTTLTKMQIDSLTDLLFNTGFGGPVFTLTESNCFTPRNAILFENKKGKTIAYIEICFQCERMETSSKRITYGEPCSQKIELLKQFFMQAGIQVGTVRWRDMNE